MSRSSDSRSAYTFKPGPYSSHTALLASVPVQGNGRRVLDLGCAEGYLSAILAGRGYRVVGVERPALAGMHFPQDVELIEADLDYGLPRLEGKFDFVLCADVLEHLRDPLALLKEVLSVLAPGGCLIASLPNSGNLYFRLIVLVGEFPQEERGLFDRTHLRFYNWNGWQALLRHGGFNVTEVRPSGIPLGMAFPRFDRSLSIRLAEWICYRLAAAWKSLFAYQFIVKALPLREAAGTLAPQAETVRAGST